MRRDTATTPVKTKANIYRHAGQPSSRNSLGNDVGDHDYQEVYRSNRSIRPNANTIMFSLTYRSDTRGYERECFALPFRFLRYVSAFSRTACDLTSFRGGPSHRKRLAKANAIRLRSLGSKSAP